MSGSQNEEPSLEELRQELKGLKDKCELQNKKIKLFRKENQDYKHELTRQAQIDSSLLINSKELSEANSKLEGAVQDISLKLDIELDSGAVASQIRANRPVALITIKNITVTEETDEVDLPNEGIDDEDIHQLVAFKGIRSLLLSENKIGSIGVAAILSNLKGVTKLQLNSNAFEADALSGIANLKNLKVLDIRNNSLGDSCMKYISQLKHLTELSISKNNLTDQGASEVKKLADLTYLDLTTNLVTDKGAQTLLGLKKLTHLYLMANRVTQHIVPLVFQAMESLEVLDVRFVINDAAVKESLRNSKPEKLQLFI